METQIIICSEYDIILGQRFMTKKIHIESKSEKNISLTNKESLKNKKRIQKMFKRMQKK